MLSSEPEGVGALANEAAQVALDHVPVDTRRHLSVVFADTIGVIMGGTQVPEIRALIEGDAIGDRLGPRLGGSDILAHGLPRADPTEAAFVNATAGTFFELDQGVRPTGHPAIHVIPAALAVAQALHSSGAELLGAVLSGCEVTVRLFEAYQLRYPVHPHGHFGAVGAATAVARLLGRPAGASAAIAATLPLLTVWEPCYEGATARNSWPGVAAEIGIKANRLANAGFKGSRGALAISFGQVVGQPRSPDVLRERIDPTELHLTRDYLKLHSACALTHSALDAVLELRTDAGSTLSVLVETISNNMKLNRQPVANSLSCRFSLPYAVAAAIVHGHARPEAFVPDPRVIELAKRVEIRQAPDLEPLWPDRAPARVTIRTNSGVRTIQVDNPRGHHLNPATKKELFAKFEMLSWASNAEDLYERLLGIESLSDCADLFSGAT